MRLVSQIMSSREAARTWLGTLRMSIRLRRAGTDLRAAARASLSVMWYARLADSLAAETIWLRREVMSRTVAHDPYKTKTGTPKDARPVCSLIYWPRVTPTQTPVACVVRTSEFPEPLPATPHLPLASLRAQRATCSVPTCFRAWPLSALRSCDA